MKLFSTCFLLLTTTTTCAFQLLPQLQLPVPTSLRVSSSSSSSTTGVESRIEECRSMLVTAAETKQEDPELVVQALVDLEKLMREQCKIESDTAQRVLDQLNGSWRLIFTTGTAESQKRLGARINYFPLKAVQSFDTSTWNIENGIYIGDLPLIQFQGDFQFNLKSRKLEFDFTSLSMLGFITIPLGNGQAAQLGASSGLGSQSNVVNSERNRKAFFNWISADETIATARGGGGGLALWKRVVVSE